MKRYLATIIICVSAIVLITGCGTVQKETEEVLYDPLHPLVGNWTLKETITECNIAQAVGGITYTDLRIVYDGSDYSATASDDGSGLEYQIEVQYNMPTLNIVVLGQSGLDRVTSNYLLIFNQTETIATGNFSGTAVLNSTDICATGNCGLRARYVH